jgi:hypothetical protein
MEAMQTWAMVFFNIGKPDAIRLRREVAKAGFGVV